jgi:hypothetical protein
VDAQNRFGAGRSPFFAKDSMPPGPRLPTAHGASEAKRLDAISTPDSINESGCRYRSCPGGLVHE